MIPGYEDKILKTCVVDMVNNNKGWSVERKKVRTGDHRKEPEGAGREPKDVKLVFAFSVLNYCR